MAPSTQSTQGLVSSRAVLLVPVVAVLGAILYLVSTRSPTEAGGDPPLTQAPNNHHRRYLQIYVAIYNVFFHPLSRFPGSKWWAMSRIPYLLMVWSGDEHKQVLKMHQKYGQVVRLAPDELSFLTPQAWDDIMGHRKTGQEENGKEECYSGSMGNSIVASKRDVHARLRRVLSHGFSAQSMLKQEPIIRKYVDLFIKQLYEMSGESKPINMMRWYNFCTFDIVGDLAFGEPFECLTKRDFHPWVAIIFDSIKFMAISIAMKHFPLIYDILERCIPKDIREKDEQRRHFSHQKVLRRIESETPRPDFTEAMISRKDEQVWSSIPSQNLSLWFFPLFL
jgi:cytochrome P450